jgi:hypothetical protein
LRATAINLSRSPRADQPGTVLGDGADHLHRFIQVLAGATQRQKRRGGDPFDDDVVITDPSLAIDLRDTGFDVAQPALLLAQRLRELGLLHGEHGAQLGRRNAVLQERCDLFER